MYDKALKQIKKVIGDFVPEYLIILGSGLGGLAEKVENPIAIKYGEIDGFMTSTAPSHAGRLIFGTLNGKNVVCMQGRLHLYEGYDRKQVVFPLRVIRKLGASKIIVTNAAGGINPDFVPGDIMIINDHINFTGTNPLIGPNDSEFGVRFPDMTMAYSKALRERAKVTAAKLGLELKEGVYIGCTGPSYETPAEIRAFRILGADAVGMSTVAEVIAARHCGYEILGFSLITNMAAGMKNVELSEEEVIEVGKQKGEALSKLVTELLV